ncbi:MAG: alanyl-tRNA editing protein [Acidobacteriaceae bacterium]
MAHRLYYADSSLISFDAQVTDIRERSRAGGQSVWQIALDRTAFYPTSGGQPNDTGTLTATAASGKTLEAPIHDVEEDESGEVWHLTTKPVLAGTAVHGAIDQPRRIDHMQQHSGQHLLSAIFDRELGARTVSFHLGEDESTIDLAVNEISADEFARVEAMANDIVQEARPMTASVVSSEQAQRLLQEGRLRKLPPRPGDMRLIEIPDLDLNACGGTHVGSTSRIGGVLLRGHERVRQGLRVTFVCGNRMLRSAHAMDALLAQSVQQLSVGQNELPQAIERLRSKLKASEKEQAALREDLVNYHVARLLVEDAIHNGRRVVRRTFSDRDAAYVKLLASRLVAAAPQTLVILASSSEDPATLVVACSADVSADCARMLKEALTMAGGRGGGSSTMAHGKLAIDQLTGAIAKIETMALEDSAPRMDRTGPR